MELYKYPHAHIDILKNIYSFISTDIRLSDLQEVLANEHYGHNGGPEIGAWINKRLYSVENS